MWVVTINTPWRGSLSLMLPEYDGMSVCRHTRHSALGKDALFAHALTSHITSHAAMGKAHLLLKPRHHAATPRRVASTRERRGTGKRCGKRKNPQDHLLAGFDCSSKTFTGGGAIWHRPPDLDLIPPSTPLFAARFRRRFPQDLPWLSRPWEISRSALPRCGG